MFLCKVAVGNGTSRLPYIYPFAFQQLSLTQQSHHCVLGYRTDGTVLITQPPNGYHSVIGEPGQALNYDEVVVYNDAAAIPFYLIVYSVAE